MTCPFCKTFTIATFPNADEMREAMADDKREAEQLLGPCVAEPKDDRAVTVPEPVLTLDDAQKITLSK